MSDRNPLTEEEIAMLLSDQKDLARPSAEFVDDLEGQLMGLTERRPSAPSQGSKSQTVPSLWRRLRLPIAASLVGLLGLLAHTRIKEGERVDEARGESPYAVVNFRSEGSDVDLEEIRLSLGQLLKHADSVVAGFLRKAKGAGEFRLEVDEVLKGQADGGSLLLENGKGVMVCPSPATFHADHFIVAFIHRGEVPTNQWKVETKDRQEHQRFCERIRAYQDGTIIDTLLREIATGEGKGPFAENDRIVEDAIAILGEKKDALRLFQLAQITEGWARHRAIAALGEAPGAATAQLLLRIRRENEWTAADRINAISVTGLMGARYVDQGILDLLAPGEIAFARRHAALSSVRDAKLLASSSAVIELWRATPDGQTGPKSAEDLPEVRASDLKALAIEALGAMGGDAAASFLIELVTTANDYYGYRGHAALALAEMKHRAAIPALQAALDDPETTGFGTGHITTALEVLRQP